MRKPVQTSCLAMLEETTCRRENQNNMTSH